MIYVTDIPDEAQMAEFYRTYGRFKGLPRRALSGLEARCECTYDPHIEILERTGGLKGRALLEVGPSFGGFLQLARSRGALVFAVELDAEALEFLAELGIPGHSSIPPEMRVDVVCAFQLVEHLADPDGFVERATAVLKTDGRLLLALPNAGEFELVGPQWVGFRVDLEHVNYFSVDTLSRLLARHNLFVEQFWQHNQPRLERAGAGDGGRSSCASDWGGVRVVRRLFRLAGFSRGRRMVVPCFREGSFVVTVLARKV